MPNIDTTRHPFIDPLSRREVVLVIGSDRDSTGVEHADIEWIYQGRLRSGCDQLADVSPDLDSAFWRL